MKGVHSSIHSKSDEAETILEVGNTDIDLHSSESISVQKTLSVQNEPPMTEAESLSSKPLDTSLKRYRPSGHGELPAESTIYAGDIRRFSPEAELAAKAEAEAEAESRSVEFRQLKLVTKVDAEADDDAEASVTKTRRLEIAAKADPEAREIRRLELEIRKQELENRRLEIADKADAEAREIRRLELENRRLEIADKADAEAREIRRQELENRRLEIAAKTKADAEEREIRRLELATMAEAREAVTTHGGVRLTLSSISMKSASAIAKDSRHLYDLFTPPCFAGAFLPNARLRLLSNLFESLKQNGVDSTVRNRILNCALSLKQSLVLQQGLDYPSGGSETKVNDPNLHVLFNHILSRVHSRLLRSTTGLPVIAVQKGLIGWNSEFILASPLSQPEYFLQDVSRKCIYLGSEAKGTDDSPLSALPQVLQLCGDSALNLRRYGLDVEDCVVPGVIAVGESFQIVAVYLMPEHLPVIVNMSPPIALRDHLTLAQWVEALSCFVEQTIALVSKTNENKRIAIRECELTNDAFFKPILLNYKLESRDSIRDSNTLREVSTQRVILDHVMGIYRRLFDVDSAIKVIQFPLGVISIPSLDNQLATCIRDAIARCMMEHFRILPKNFDEYTHTPCLVFPYLRSGGGWSNERPEPRYVQSYLQQVSLLVNILNLAGVVHMDLRPENIMWRPLTESDVEIQAIDFEEALLVGEAISASLAHFYVKDARHPMTESMIQEPVVVAQIGFNDFFFESITNWLNTPDINISFCSFMLDNAPKRISKQIKVKSSLLTV